LIWQLPTLGTYLSGQVKFTNSSIEKFSALFGGAEQSIASLTSISGWILTLFQPMKKVQE
jgi:hypothetical protein